MEADMLHEAYSSAGVMFADNLTLGNRTFKGQL